MEDEEIRALLSRLGRPHRSGGVVVERAAILAEGADSGAVVDWILAHDGEPEAQPPKRVTGGLHGMRGAEAPADRPPSRFVLPAGVLT